jgi:hypothetical protein
MTDWQKEIETKIKELEKVPDRNILKAQSGRANFIRAASKAKSDSLLPDTRHIWWNPITRKKENFKMNIATLIVILSLLFGGSGVTAVAAQASLPGDFLYPVKILSEDVRLELATQPESQVKLALKFAASRFEEIQSLIEAGLMPPDPTVVRWHNQIRIALEEALVSEDQTVQLLMVQEMLQQQLQKMNYLAVDPAVQAWMNQFQFQFQNQLQMVNAGLNEPQKLQQELKWMNQFMNNLETEGQIYQWQQMFQNQAMGEDSQYLWQFQNAHQNQQGINEDETGQNQNENPVEDPGFNNGATDPGENGNGEAQGSNAGTNTNGNGQNGGSGGK